MTIPDFDKAFDYENDFYLSCPVSRISKLVSHLDLFRLASEVPGEIVECGVFKGVSLARWVKFRDLLLNAFSKKIVAFDTFGQFPEPSYEPDRRVWENFVQNAGEQSISIGEMHELLARLGLDQNLELVAGDICQTVPAFVKQNPQMKISLLNLDVDTYEPTRVCLESLYPLMSLGGIMILDDYGVFPGANKAIDDFFAGRPERIVKLPYSHALSYVKV